MSESLRLLSVVGFGGSIPNGLILHPDGTTLIYPLGSTIVLRDKGTVESQQFLQGHTDKVSCLAISRSGKYLASGQVTYMGFTADIIVWDMEARALLHRMSLHKVKVQALDFSFDERRLVSLGGQDDNSLVLWNVETGAAICGSPTHSDFTLCVKFLNNCRDVLITAGKYNLNVWEHDGPNNKLREMDVQLGQLRRIFNCICIDSQDRFVYCGTTSGDVLQISIETKLMKNLGIAKGPISLGVTASCHTPEGRLFVGAGDGSIRLLKVPPEAANPKLMKKNSEVAVINVDGAIASLVTEAETQAAVCLLVGTVSCNLYRITWAVKEMRFTSELLQTAHSDKVNDLALLGDSSDVFVTCGLGNVRLWHLDTCREVLRIRVPNLECHCVDLFRDGSCIVSGWSDGAIRAFGPQSGKLLFSIHNAHHKAVTAIASTGDCNRIISGGEEGMVRVWGIRAESQVMEASMKEHKGPVNCIQIKESTSDECVSCSSDGSCIIWDLTTFKRRNSLFANTFFKAVVYQRDESQLVTGGTDRKITYWDPFDGQPIRILDGSSAEPVNALAIDPAGETIVSGGSDKLIKLWGYDEGHCYYTGVAHSGPVAKVAITQDMSRILSVGAEGGIFVWEFAKPRPLPEDIPLDGQDAE
ncbi:unnamed protein product [Ostreobium quekettii]|uniref:Cilia- and flagella-associated protein 52 n=1 Tax=Ostreobium quekettii TaxID=121088 RepID=A0A8S1IM87_9CHLO|nr:unnamed protein product [Ostreobium quekettii]